MLINSTSTYFVVYTTFMKSKYKTSDSQRQARYYSTYIAY